MMLPHEENKPKQDCQYFVVERFVVIEFDWSGFQHVSHGISLSLSCCLFVCLFVSVCWLVGFQNKVKQTSLSTRCHRSEANEV